MRARRPAATLTLVVALLAAACGSRVPETTTAAGALAPVDEFVAGGAASAPSTVGGPAATTRAGNSPSAARLPDGTPAGPRASGSAPGPSVPTAPTGPIRGLTDEEITIGVYTALAFNNAVKALGINSVSTGDHENQAQAMADHLNEHGGIAGRKIRLVFHDKSANDNATVSAQKACSAWTEDDQVYAAVSPVAIAEESLYACLAKKNVIFAAAGEVFDRDFFRRFGNTYYQPADINLTRTFVTMVDSLKGAGYFGAAPKIGMIGRDIPAEHRAVEQGLRPALGRHGLKLDEAFYASTDASQTANDYQAAVLRFKAKGITHVMFASLAAPFTFAQAAEPQQYHPRYGLNSRHAPAALLQLTVPHSQLRGAMGPGWIPWEDVDEQRDPGPVSPRATQCKQIMEDAGENMNVRATALIAAWYCDTFFFLHDAMAKATSYTPAGFRAAVNALGSSYRSASTFRSTFGPDRTTDGASTYRVFAFRDNCGCFEYTTGKRDAAS